MVTATAEPAVFDASRPIDLMSRDFAENKYDWYRWMLEEAPVCRGKISVMQPSRAT